MQTKVEVYPAIEQEDGGFWACVCIHVGSYYEAMEKSRVYCLGKQAASDVAWKLISQDKYVDVMLTSPPRSNFPKC